MQDITINVYALLGFCPSTTWWLKIHYVLLYTVNSKFRHPLRQTQKCNMEEHGPWPLKLILKTVFPLQKPGAAFNFLCWRKCNLDHLYIYNIRDCQNNVFQSAGHSLCPSSPGEEERHGNTTFFTRSPMFPLQMGCSHGSHPMGFLKIWSGRSARRSSAPFFGALLLRLRGPGG